MHGFLCVTAHMRRDFQNNCLAFSLSDQITLSLKGSVATYFHSSNSNMLNCLMLATNIGQVKTNIDQNCHNGLIAFQGGQISLPSHGGSQL